MGGGGLPTLADPKRTRTRLFQRADSFRPKHGNVHAVGLGTRAQTGLCPYVTIRAGMAGNEVPGFTYIRQSRRQFPLVGCALEWWGRFTTLLARHKGTDGAVPLRHDPHRHGWE